MIARIPTGAPAALVAGMLAIGLAATRPAEAQVRLQGRVIAEHTAAPIPDAQVYITTLRGRRLGGQVTDEEGRFTFFVRGHGAVKLQASRLGYKATTTPALFFDEYDTYQVEIRLDTEATLLAPLEVRARTSRFFASGMLSGFDYRRQSAPGVFFTREEIEKLRPGYVTDLLVTVPGVAFQSSGTGSRRRVVMARAAGQCPAQVFIDGFLMSRDQEFAIDEAVSPQAVHGIEVYRGLSTVPADFLTPSAACGVIVIWTRRTG